MKKVREVMSKKVITVGPEASLYDVAKILKKNRISGAPVVQEDKVIGIVTEADLMKMIESQDFNIHTLLPSPLEVFELPVRMKLKLDESLERIKKATKYRVGDMMTKKVIDISPNATIAEAARVMSKNDINRLPVIDTKGKLIGIVTRGDVIGAL